MGWLRQDARPGDPNFGVAVRCTCQMIPDQQLLYQRSLRASNLSGWLLNATLRNFAPTDGTLEAHHALSLFAHEPQGWITLLGGVGTGKTHLLAAVATALLSTTARPLYCVVPEFLAFLRESFDAGQSESCSRRFEAVRNAGVLLLDDLGAEKETEWTQEQLYRVINHRYNEGLPTLIASNVPLDEIEPRIASRIRDSRIGQVIVLTGPDYRARKARS
jgi:DNA replication protein DnaC